MTWTPSHEEKAILVASGILKAASAIETDAHWLMAQPKFNEDIVGALLTQAEQLRSMAYGERLEAQRRDRK